MSRDDKKAAIIGNGGAGAECVKSLRESGYRGENHIFSDSQWPIYNPMLTTYYAAGKIGFEQMFPFGNGDEFYRKYQVEDHIKSPVMALDTERRIAANKAGFELVYDLCLIASGASPVLPAIEGINCDKVFTMRTVEDAIRLRKALERKPRKALVIGASMVGIKVMELFYNAGIEVCLADLADRIFPLAAHPDCSQVIEARLRQKGIELKFGVCIEKVEDTPSGIKACFDRESESEGFDLLVMCTGMRPNIDFVDRKRIEAKQGILINERMETSVPGVFAAGDVAQGNNLLSGEPQITGLWANARYQGRTAGRNMAGNKEIYPGTIPHNITHFLGMDFVGIGDICEYDRMETAYDGKRFHQLFWKGNLLTGANLIDEHTESGILKNALVKGLIQNRNDIHSRFPAVQNLMIRKVLTEVEQK